MGHDCECYIKNDAEGEDLGMFQDTKTEFVCTHKKHEQIYLENRSPDQESILVLSEYEPREQNTGLQIAMCVSRFVQMSTMKVPQHFRHVLVAHALVIPVMGANIACDGLAMIEPHIH
jgi:hypothetical protein